MNHFLSLQKIELLITLKDKKFFNFFTLKYAKIMCKTNASFLSSLNTYCFL